MIPVSETTLQGNIYLGGSGYPLVPGVSCDVTFSDQEIRVRALRGASFSIPLIEVCSIEISGPGNVTKGGGFIGGGFGVDGALAGIALAGILNALTTKSEIHTFLAVTSNVGEMHLHYPGMEPAALRIALADTFTRLRRLDSAWQRQRISILEMQKEYGQLSEEDFDRLKERVIHSLQQNPTQTISATVFELPKDIGSCPSCHTTIPLSSQECPKCRAMFGEGATWKIIPL
ncbi:hypothetical protein [Azohydromonas lata]|uniref:hypothetical protein n=1 Tax=Azohydromonas lata TaxID=45677 RepID=UPI0012F4A98F|nr:hypothetical protein [Azohydromonas lata]